MYQGLELDMYPRTPLNSRVSCLHLDWGHHCPAPRRAPTWMLKSGLRTLNLNGRWAIVCLEVKPDAGVEGRDLGPSSGLRGVSTLGRGWAGIPTPPHPHSHPQASLGPRPHPQGPLKPAAALRQLGRQRELQGKGLASSRSWFKLVWAGCGLCRLHSRPLARSAFWAFPGLLRVEPGARSRELSG